MRPCGHRYRLESLRQATDLIELYQDRFSDSDSRVEATFELLSLTGWSPHASQQKPLQPGSAQARLAEVLDTEEISGGEKASPFKSD